MRKIFACLALVLLAGCGDDDKEYGAIGKEASEAARKIVSIAAQYRRDHNQGDFTEAAMIRDGVLPPELVRDGAMTLGVPGKLYLDYSDGCDQSRMVFCFEMRELSAADCRKMADSNPFGYTQAIRINSSEVYMLAGSQGSPSRYLKKYPQYVDQGCAGESNRFLWRVIP